MEDRVRTRSPAGCSGAASPRIQPQQACGTLRSHGPCVRAGLGGSHQPRALLAWHKARTLHRPQEKWGWSPALRSHQGQHHMGHQTEGSGAAAGSDGKSQSQENKVVLRASVSLAQGITRALTGSLPRWEDKQGPRGQEGAAHCPGSDPLRRAAAPGRVDAWPEAPLSTVISLLVGNFK